MPICSKQMLCCSLVLGLVLSQFVRAADQTPEEAASFFLTESDVTDFPAFLVKLRDGVDPLAIFIRDNMGGRSLDMLYSYRDRTPPADELKTALLAELNALVTAERIYESDRFDTIPLSSETRALIQRDPEGAELVRLNRMLLEQAFPDQLAVSPVQAIDVRADSLEYDGELGLFIAHGRVMLRRGDVTIRSELAVVNIETYDVLAEGDVFFEEGENVWSGERLRYNFRTRRGDFGKFVSFLDPFYVHAEKSHQVSETEYRFHNALVTTCEGDDPVAYVKARTMTVVPGRHAKGRHVLLYLGKVPVMYSPYWRQNIGSPNFFSAAPGYNKRMWAYILAAFNYRLSRHVETTTRLDYRMRRGPGVGQDFLWSESGRSRGLSTERHMEDEDEHWFLGRRPRTPDVAEKDAWSGDLVLYYTRDSWPDEGRKQDYAIPRDRYRFRYYHGHDIGEHNYFLSQINYLSDPRIIQHFFRDEYKHAPEPENYLLLGRRGDRYNAHIRLENRLNDFYTVVERAPEAAVDFSRRELGDTLFYYEGRTAAGRLQKRWESAETNETDYSSFRLDSDHTLYYQMKWFRFLNVTPRAGYRATFYSDTREVRQEKEQVDELDDEGQPKLDDEGDPVYSWVTNDVTYNMGSELRIVRELGLESSFKAFRVWDAHPGGLIHNLRHIAEPYIDYTYRPEPNILPANLYHFDEVDRINRAHDIKLGMINKIQTRQRGSVYDLINADIWSFYRLEPEDDEQSFSNIRFNIRSQLLQDWMTLLLTGEFDQYENSIERFNTRLTVEDRRLWKNELEHRYRRDRNSLLSNRLSLTPFGHWKYNLYARYEFEERDLEAWGASIERVIDCITVRAGAEMQDDDYSFWIKFWFTEFPKARVDLGV